jgi:hypothetical protein
VNTALAQGFRVGQPLQSLLRGYDLDSIEDDDSIIIGLDAQLNIQLLNPAWDVQAEQFGASGALQCWQLERCILDAVSGAEGDFYRAAFVSAAHGERPWRWAYDCDDEHTRRRYLLVSYPLGQGAQLLVHSKVYEMAVDGSPAQAIRARYRQDDGVIVRCAYCARFRHPARQSLWEATAEETRDTHDVSHGICHLCASFHFG